MFKRVPDISLGRRLGLLQVVVVVAGIFATALTVRMLEVEATRRGNLEKQLQVRNRLQEVQDKWIAWRLLGLHEALDREIRQLETEIPGITVTFKLGEITAGPNEVVVPELAEEGHPRMVAYVQPIRVRSAGYTDRLPIVLVTAGSFLLLLLVTFTFARKNVIVPLRLIGESVERFQKSGQFTVPKGRFSGEMALLVEWLEQVHFRTREMERYEAVANLARQVAHDIRSPLSALSLVLSDAHLNPESARLSRLAMERIEGIAATLSAKHSRQNASVAPSPVRNPPVFHACTVIDEAVLEKRRELSAVSDEALRYSASVDAAGSYLSCDDKALRIALSNILNNAAESGSDLSEISIEVRRQDGNLCIEVSDHGRGIPKLALEHWGERGYSVGKPDGTGLGVFQACTFAQESGGSITARNSATGARVRLLLPCASPPPYVIQEIALTPRTRVLVGDDDPSILAILRTRFEAEAPGVDCRYFDTAEEMESAIADACPTVPHVILSDLQFGPTIGPLRFRGSQVVQRAQERGFAAVLITSYANDILSGRESIPSGCFLLPKNLVTNAPIRVSPGNVS